MATRVLPFYPACFRVFVWGILVRKVLSQTTWDFQSKLTSSDGTFADFFGSAVAVDGDTVVVGSYLDDDKGISSGSIHVFVKGSDDLWLEQAKLTAGDGSTQDFFGRSVDISGDSIVVGADGDDDMGADSGSAYVFQRTGDIWIQVDKILPATGQRGDEFGQSVAIYRNTIVIGAPGANDRGSNSGAVVVFNRVGDSWIETTRISPNDGQVFDFFGSSLDIDGATLVVGAYQDDVNGRSDVGSAYVFIYDGASWLQQARLFALDGASLDFFGWDVAVSEDTVVVGNYLDEDNGVFAGSAYVFLRSGGTWSQQAKLTSSNIMARDNFFGRSVAVSGSAIVCGASGDNAAGSRSGAAYVFTRSESSWTLQTVLSAGDGSPFDYLGSDVAVSDEFIVAGAYGDSNQAGSAYIFQANVQPTSFPTREPSSQPTGAPTISLDTAGPTTNPTPALSPTDDPSASPPAGAGIGEVTVPPTGAPRQCIKSGQFCSPGDNCCGNQFTCSGVCRRIIIVEEDKRAVKLSRGRNRGIINRRRYLKGSQ